jgi:hypothetical protein
MIPIRIAVLSLAILVPLAGCGSGGGSTASDEASKTPAQILADTQRALGSVSSFHIAGTQTDKNGPSTITGDVSLPGKVHIALHQGAVDLEIIVIGADGYFKANLAFWQGQGSPAAAGLFAGRWAKVPAASAPGFSQFSALTNPATIGHCFLGSRHGAITKVGTSSVAGAPVVVLADDGKAPGTSPGQVYIASTGQPLPLRSTQTGPQQPGGVPDATCNEKDVSSSTTAGDITYSAYNQPVSIVAPAGAISLPGGSGLPA